VNQKIVKQEKILSKINDVENRRKDLFGFTIPFGKFSREKFSG
jgi:hypothetical protein